MSAESPELPVESRSVDVEKESSLPQRWHELDLRFGLRRTIRFARIRCMPREEIIEQVLKGESDELEAYAYRLGEIKLSASELDYVTQKMTELARETEDAPPRKRSVVDKSLLRFVRLLPRELATRFSDPYLSHGRKARRKWAYAVLHNEPVTGRNVARVAETYQKTGDKELLTCIVRTPECVRILGADYLLRRIDEPSLDYLRGRVLQALLTYDRPAALTLSRTFPWEFVYAAGRSEDSTLTPAVHSLFERNAHDIKFLAIYAWTLGKLKARAELDILEEFLKKQAEIGE